SGPWPGPFARAVVLELLGAYAPSSVVALGSATTRRGHRARRRRRPRTASTRRVRLWRCAPGTPCWARLDVADVQDGLHDSGMAPSCLRMPSWSKLTQCSTI